MTDRISEGTDTKSPTQRAAERLHPHFLFIARSRIIEPLLKASSTSKLSAQGEVLAKNLEAVITTTMLPATFAMNEVWNLRLQRILLAEQIEAGAYRSDLHKVAYEAAAQRAADRCHQEFDTEEGLDRWLDEAATRLLNQFGSSEIKQASEELLRQSVVSVWGSFEVFSGDCATSLINSSPKLGIALIKSEKTRKLFGQISSISLEDLANFDFNLTGKLGDLILASRRIDALAAIREVFTVLAPQNESLNRGLKSPLLWMLNQRRHLIVHRRGVVDGDYLSQTSDSLEIGEQLQIRSNDIVEYLGCVRDISIELLQAFPIAEDVVL